jgi:hypothetical protein
MSGGTLYHDIHKVHRLDARQLTIVALDIARGLRFLHSQSIIHRDLKSLNVLLTAGGLARLCDFGYSRTLSTHDERMTGNIGTPHWMAPEMLDGSGMYDERVDIYGYGIVLWEIMTKKIPYAGMDADQIIAQVGTNDIRPTIPPTAPDAVRDLIQRCWDRDPDRRPSILETIGLFASGRILFPGANPSRIESYVRSSLDEGEYPTDTELIPTLVGIERKIAMDDVSPELAERSWQSLKAIDRAAADRTLYLKCLTFFLKTQRIVEAAAMLRLEPSGSIPYDAAVKVSSLLPTGKDLLNVDLVLIACKNGAAAEAAIHSFHPNHVKLALEVVARTGVRNEESKRGIVQRCLNSLRGNDPMLIVAAVRCLIALGDANQIPIDVVQSYLQSRNTTLRLAGYVAAAEIAGIGLPLSTDVIDACVDRMGTIPLAAAVLVGACGNVENGRYLVGKLAKKWMPPRTIAVKMLLRASEHQELVAVVRGIAERIQVPESEQQEHGALEVTKRR